MKEKIENFIYGRTPVKNAILAGKKPVKVFLAESSYDKEIFKEIQKRKIPFSFLSNGELSKMCSNANHQGVVCQLPEFQYADLDDVLKRLQGKDDALIVLLDGIVDPVNFGSIIRTSAAFNADCIIIGKNRQVQVTPTVAKVATGAEEFIDIVQVNNLHQCVERLKKEYYWVVTSAGESQDYYDDIDYKRRIVLVVGSEGFGASRIVKETSDYRVKIPMNGPIKALNASIACAILLAQITSNRRH